MKFHYNSEGIRLALLQAESTGIESHQRGGLFVALYEDGTTSGLHSPTAVIVGAEPIAVVPVWYNDTIEDAGTVQSTIDWIMENYENGNDLGFWKE